MSGTKAVLESFRNTVAFNLKAIEREIADLEAVSEPTSLDELRARAMGTFYAGLYPQARPLINALVGLEPTERNIVKLAQVEHRLGNTVSAISIAENVLNSNTQCLAACEVLAHSLLDAGDYEKAFSAAKRALALEPDSQRMKAISMLAEFASNKTDIAGLTKLKQTGDSGVDALVSSLFADGAVSDLLVADLPGRLSELEMGSLMARSEPMM